VTLTALVLSQAAEQISRGVLAGLSVLGKQRVMAAAMAGEDLTRELVATYKDKIHLLAPGLRKTLLALLAPPESRVEIVERVYRRLAADPDFGVLAVYEDWLRDNLWRAANLLYVHLTRMEG